jgi:AraC-like DNA-binding protein
MPAKGVMNVSVRSVKPVVERLRTLGLDPGPVLVATGMDAATLDDAEARIPHEMALALWNEAVRCSGDDAFGIHAAEEIRPGAFDVLDYATRSSATLGEGLRRFVRYHRVLHDGAMVELKVDGSRVVLTHALPEPAALLPRQIAEFIVAAWLVVARQATGVDLVPVEVRFRHSAPEDRREHARLFRAPIRFDSDANGMVLRCEALDAPLVKSDPGLCAVLERHVAELLQQIPTATGFIERVQQLVAKDLASGLPDAGAVARALRMSRRTLQRQLRNDGTSYKEVVDALRRELATRYLSERRVAVGEIAFLLGFSETSAFHRAFKRWTGTTPAAYRRSQGVLSFDQPDAGFGK